jgi:double-strand break repair protein MRE11
VQFYRKKTTAGRKGKNEPDLPDQARIEEITLDSIKVEKLVREFLSAQSLTILPQNTFGDAVSQFVDKDDKHSMEFFVDESLKDQLKHLMKADGDEDEHIENAMDQHRSTLEELFAAGHLKKRRKEKVKPKPDHWDSELDGPWEDQPGAIYRSEASDDDGNADSVTTTKGTSRGQGVTRSRGRGGRGAAAASTRKAATASKKVTVPTRGSRGKKKVIEEDNEDESDVQMILDDDEEESEPMFVPPKKKAPAVSAAKAPPKKQSAPATRQRTLNFSQQTQYVNSRSGVRPKAVEIVSQELRVDCRVTNKWIER